MKKDFSDCFFKVNVTVNGITTFGPSFKTSGKR